MLVDRLLSEKSNINFSDHIGIDKIDLEIAKLSDVIVIYQNSPEWHRLSDRTKYVWSRIVARIVERWGSSSIAIWSDHRQLQAILKWRNEWAHKPRTADHQLTVLHHFLAWARLHGWVETNIGSKIPRLYRNGGRAEIIWLDDEVERFCKAAPMVIADGMRLAAATGLRRADLVGLTWQEIEHLRINRVTEKSGRRRARAMVPITPDLRSLLDELADRHRAPAVKTVLVNQSGKSWTGDGFGHGFNAVRDRLSIKHTDGRPKHLHDVRGTYATKLVRAGLSDQQIGDIMGWSVQQVGEIRKIYVEDDAAIQAIIEQLARSPKE